MTPEQKQSITHCAACIGTDYIGRPCRGTVNLRPDLNAAIAREKALAEAVAAFLARHDDPTDQHHLDLRAVLRQHDEATR